MTDFARNYAPPGVYIDESETSLVSVSGIPPTIVAFVGPARGYQINTEQVPLGNDSVRLSKQGIAISSVVITVVSTREEVAATDYTVTASGSTESNEHYCDLADTNQNALPDGTPVFVTYQYTVPEYYTPQRVSSYEDVKDLYGEPLNLTSATPGDTAYEYVLSPLSLAAQLAFKNGASEMYLCATTPPPAEATTDSAKSTARQAAIAAAYLKVSTIQQINVIVPVTTGIAAADAPNALIDLKNHLATTADDGLLRFGVIGFDPTVTTAPDTLLATSGAEYRRMMLAYTGPSGVLMYSGGGNTTFAVGHQYLASAYAGLFAVLPVQRSLTKQVLSGFSGLAGTPLSNSLKNQYAAAGVAITEVDRSGRLVVRHGVTTDTTNVNTKESAVVRARDAMVTVLQEGTSNSDLIGQPLDDETVLAVKSAVQGMLEFCVSEGTIIGYNGLGVRQVSVDPSVVEVKFAYRPAYPLNYIMISFSIDMSTGTTDLTETV